MDVLIADLTEHKNVESDVPTFFVTLITVPSLHAVESSVVDALACVSQKSDKHNARIILFFFIKLFEKIK
jgi:hypothetical protein